MLTKGRLGLRLRYEEDEGKPGVCRREPAKRHVSGSPALEVKHKPGARVAFGHERVGDANGLQEFERSSLDGQRSRLSRPVASAIDDVESRTERLELCGERQAGRPGPDNEDIERHASPFRYLPSDVRAWGHHEL